MAPSAVPLVKDAIRSVTYSQAHDLANVALQSESATGVLDLCRRLVHQTAPEILELVE